MNTIIQNNILVDSNESTNSTFSSLSELPFDILSLIFSFVFVGLDSQYLLYHKKNLSLVCRNLNNHLASHIDFCPSLKSTLYELILKKMRPEQLEVTYKTNILFSSFSSFEDVVKDLLLKCDDVFDLVENPWITDLAYKGLIDSEFALAFLETHLSRYSRFSCLTLRDLVLCIIRDKKRVPVDIMVLIMSNMYSIYEYRTIQTKREIEACHEVFMALFLTWRDIFLSVFKNLPNYNNTFTRVENEFISKVMSMDETTPCVFNICNLYLEDGYLSVRPSYHDLCVSLESFPFLKTHNDVEFLTESSMVPVPIVLIPFFPDNDCSSVLFNIEQPSFAEPGSELIDDDEHEQQRADYYSDMYDYEEDRFTNDDYDDYDDGDRNQDDDDDYDY
jgi:hypothetical protein